MKLFRASLIALIVCTMSGQIALAQSDLGFKGAGLRMGLVSPDGIDATIGFGAFADLGTFAPTVGWEAYADYWSQSEGVQFVGSASVRDFTLGSRAKYLIPVNNTKLQPFVGGGLGLHFLKASVDIPEQDIGGFLIPATNVSQTSTKLGLDLGGGLSTPISNQVDFLGEAWFGLVSDVNQFSLKIGAMYKFGQ